MCDPRSRPKAPGTGKGQVSQKIAKQKEAADKKGKPKK
jgi:hypothetical protein